MLFPSFSASSTSFWRNFKNCTAKFHSLFFCSVHFILGEKCTSSKNEHSSRLRQPSRMEEEIEKIFRALALESAKQLANEERKKAFFIKCKGKLVRSLCHLSCQTSIELGSRACTLLNSYFNLFHQQKNLGKKKRLQKSWARIKAFDVWKSLFSRTRSNVTLDL